MMSMGMSERSYFSNRFSFLTSFVIREELENEDLLQQGQNMTTKRSTQNKNKKFKNGRQTSPSNHLKEGLNQVSMKFTSIY